MCMLKNPGLASQVWHLGQKIKLLLSLLGISRPSCGLGGIQPLLKRNPDPSWGSSPHPPPPAPSPAAVCSRSEWR